MEAISSLSFPKQASQVGLCENGTISADNTRLQTIIQTHCRKKSDLGKASNCTPFPFLHGERKVKRKMCTSLTLFMFVQVRAETQAQKKEEVSASHKPSALFLPQHPRCLLSSLSSSCTSFFFYDLPLLWIIQSHTLLGSHQLSHSQRCAAV